MSIKYDSKREPLAEIIKKATVNATTYVIPDLQRPYVWSPRQVTMLVDSLFRGWPFGSLLLWEVKPDCFQEGDGIPHRPFWQVIGQTGNEQGTYREYPLPNRQAREDVVGKMGGRLDHTAEGQTPRPLQENAIRKS
jgi:hypothetical protein